jgi:hypothetical protein
MFCQDMPAENVFQCLKAEPNPKGAKKQFVYDMVLLESNLE